MGFSPEFLTALQQAGIEPSELSPEAVIESVRASDQPRARETAHLLAKMFPSVPSPTDDFQKASEIRGMGVPKEYAGRFTESDFD